MDLNFLLFFVEVKRNGRLPTITLLGLGMLVAVGGCGREPTPTMPKGCVFFSRGETAEIRVTLSNPRKVGQHYFARSDGSMISSEKNQPDDVEVYEYNVTLYVFVKRESAEEYQLPVHERLIGRMGGMMGGYTQEWGGLFDPNHTLSHPNVGELRIPVTDDIHSYLFVIKANTEDIGWCVLEVNADDVPNRASDAALEVPDLLTLPLFDTRDDHARLLQAVDASNDRLWEK